MLGSSAAVFADLVLMSSTGEAWLAGLDCAGAANLKFFDVYSDEFFDCVDPMSRAGSSRGVQARS